MHVTLVSYLSEDVRASALENLRGALGSTPGMCAPGGGGREDKEGGASGCKG